MSTIKTTVIQPLASGGILSIKQGDGITDVLQIDGSGRLGIRMPSGVGLASPMTINHNSTGTVMTGPSSYGGIHLHQSSGNNGFVGITSKATSNGTQGGFLIEGSSSFGTKLHLMTTNSYTQGMKHRVVVDHLGNVGIGTLTPAVSLDIVGEARSSTSTNSASNDKTLVTKDYVDEFPRVRAWVTFTGTSAVGTNCTIRDSYGVGSVNHISLGNYTINFSATQITVNYCVSICHSPTDGGHHAPVISSMTTNSVGIFISKDISASYPGYNPSTVCVSILY